MTIVHQPELRPLSHKQVHAGNTVPSKVREDAYLAKAVDLGIQPGGYWPLRFTTNLGNGQDFAVVSILPAGVRCYQQLNGNLHLFVS